VNWASRKFLEGTVKLERLEWRNYAARSRREVVFGKS
jgi:hypothetical protein